MPVIAAVAPFGRDVEEDLARIARLLGAARAAGAELVVLPESALGGYIREGAAAPDVPAGLDSDGPEIAALVALTGNTVVCAGYTEAGGGHRYSSAVCVSGDGVLGRQRKVHLPPGERFAFRPGRLCRVRHPGRPDRDAVVRAASPDRPRAVGARPRRSRTA